MTTDTAAPLVSVQQLTQAEYRADPRLATHSRVRKMLPPSCPAIAKYELDNPVHSDAFDFGKAAHAEVLGAGDEYVIIAGTGVDENAWRTQADKTAVAEAREQGKTPVTPAQAEQVIAMADQVRRHPLAAALFQPGQGKPEQAILWPDEQIPQVQRGTMLDWLPERTSHGRLLVADYKSAGRAHPSEWAKSAADYGYHSQAAWSLDGLHALYPDLGEDDVAFLFVVQSKTPPYPVVVVELDAEAIRVGRGLNRWAIQLWHRCWEQNEWPGYSSEVEQVSLPAWYVDRWRPIT